MPIYEYHCRSCSHHFELLQKMTDAAPSTCPKCNMSDVERLVSAAGFELKGTGWYATDFKNGPKPKADAASKTTTETAAATPAAAEPAVSPKSSSTEKVK
jgi:putative FmdB family regulatory protein